jgi:LPS export ABC transporter protein LptC
MQNAASEEAERAHAFAALLLAGLLACIAAGPSAARAAEATSLEVQGMTFVGSRAGVRELVLRSKTAWLRPETQFAELKDVSAIVTEEEAGRSFTMTCARVELDIEHNDFLAEGDVHGETADGQRYSAPWVRYAHEAGLLFTDAPVEMHDRRGSFRGDGFRYHVHDRRFELLGNVRVEQRP